MTRRLLTAGCLLAALVLGWQLPNAEYLLLGIIGALAFMLVANWLTGLAPDVFLGGLILFGYLVGNRGFAQLQMPGLPMLPAEAVLGIGTIVVIWHTTRTKTLPIRRDTLNFAVAAWIAVGLARLPHDVRTNGFVAVRDFALVYYAVFFFLAQEWCKVARSRQWIERCVTAGLMFTTPVFVAFILWPNIFINLTIAGIPPIYVKGDVAGGFMAAGVFWFGRRYVLTRDWPWLALTIVSGAGTVFCNSRAALLALVLGTVALLILRERRLFKLLLGITAGGCLLLTAEAVWPHPPGQSSEAFRIYESLQSITDFSGTNTPISEDLGDKPDNNRFRMVWWQAVLLEARDNGLWLGLGFGHDLADQFVRTYYADDPEEFNTRSPHNFVITVFARMGIVGLVLLLSILAIMARRTVQRAWAAPDTGTSAPWLFSWMIFVTACFGVVMEGPMGAVLFWTMLGMANVSGPEPAVESGTGEDVPDRVPEGAVAAAALPP